MIGLDTNVLLRYFVMDDAKQHKMAANLIEKHCTAQQPAWINLIVLCEFIWVLRAAYEYKKVEIIKLLDLMLDSPELEIEFSGEVRRALFLYVDSAADFSDCLISVHNKEKPCNITYTFDQKASLLPTMMLIE